MSSRQLENWLKTYMYYTSFSEAPDKFHFWVGIWTIAGALRRRVWIDQAYFQWTPNFYIVFVAPPGIATKSTTLSTGKFLLSSLEGIKFGPDAVTWQSLVQSLSEANEAVLMEDGSYHAMSCVTIASSEFGTFLNPANGDMINVLVDLWDGKLGVWEKRTKTQGSDRIENPWINIAACTTPDWIAGNFPEYLIGGGFTSRCVFVYARDKRKLVAYPAEHIPQDFEQIQKQLIHDLEAISILRGQFQLSKPALEWGTNWYETHWGSRPKELDNKSFAGYLSRKQTHIHKLAMVLSAAYKDDLIITTEDLSMAAEIVTSLEKDMPQVFELIGVEGNAKHSQRLLETLRAYGQLDQAQLFHLCFKSMSWREFQEAAVAGLQSGNISSEQVEGRIMFTYRGK